MPTGPNILALRGDDRHHGQRRQGADDLLRRVAGDRRHGVIGRHVLAVDGAVPDRGETGRRRPAGVATASGKT